MKDSTPKVVRASDSMPKEKLSKALKFALKEFDAVKVPGVELYNEHKYRDYETFPIPELVLFTLRDLFGCPWTGTEEKVRWSVYCTFRGKPWMFQMRKLGFAVLYKAESARDLEDILKRVRKAVNIASRFLERTSDEQVSKGNVTFQNQFNRLVGRYRYFRQRASRAIRASKKTQPKTKVLPGGMTLTTDGKYNYLRIADYDATAMIDSYFSLIEHVLILVLPFEGFDPSGGRLKAFISGPWDEKFKNVFDVRKEPAKSLYQGLKALKERHRNPASHGGIKKGLASFYFHLNDIGAIPGNLLKSSETPDHFVGPEEFQGICALFDTIDALFKSETRAGYTYAKEGFDVAFDEANRMRYQLAKRSDDALKEFIKYQGYLWDHHANMDY